MSRCIEEAAARREASTAFSRSDADNSRSRRSDASGSVSEAEATCTLINRKTSDECWSVGSRLHLNFLEVLEHRGEAGGLPEVCGPVRPRQRERCQTAQGLRCQQKPQAAADLAELKGCCPSSASSPPSPASLRQRQCPKGSVLGTLAALLGKVGLAGSGGVTAAICVPAL